MYSMCVVLVVEPLEIHNLEEWLLKLDIKDLFLVVFSSVNNAMLYLHTASPLVSDCFVQTFAGVSGIMASAAAR